MKRKKSNVIQLSIFEALSPARVEEILVKREKTLKIKRISKVRIPTPLDTREYKAHDPEQYHMVILYRDGKWTSKTSVADISQAEDWYNLGLAKGCQGIIVPMEEYYRTYRSGIYDTYQN